MPDKKFWVYEVLNLTNGKKYIGCATGDVRARWRNHKCHAFLAGSEAYNTHFSRALRKYGLISFIFRVVYEASSGLEMHAVEKGLIAQYGTMNNKIGYNMTCGGEGTIGLKMSEVQRKLMSERSKGRPNLHERKLSDEQVNRILSCNTPGRKLANLMGISPDSIWRIRKGTYYIDVVKRIQNGLN